VPQNAKDMGSWRRGRGAPYAESTKLQIIGAVCRKPGCTGRQIAESLGLDRSRVNSFLYGEGKQKFGLEVKNWRWYPARNSIRGFEQGELPTQPPGNPNPNPPQGGDLPTNDSICSMLSRLSITNATLKIRAFSLTLVELAFNEDEYPALDERLQAELIIRKKTLEATTQTVHTVRQGTNRWVWVVIIILGVWIFALHNSQNQPGRQNLPQQRGDTEQLAPRQ
jgi:Winged helix-turn-helix DNA-binding